LPELFIDDGAGPQGSLVWMSPSLPIIVDKSERIAIEVKNTSGGAADVSVVLRWREIAR
jgi:hypothetical protein